MIDVHFTTDAVLRIVEGRGGVRDARYKGGYRSRWPHWTVLVIFPALDQSIALTHPCATMEDAERVFNKFKADYAKKGIIT